MIKNAQLIFFIATLLITGALLIGCALTMRTPASTSTAKTLATQTQVTDTGTPPLATTQAQSSTATQESTTTAAKPSSPTKATPTATPIKTALPSFPPDISPSPPPTLPTPGEGKSVVWGVMMWNDQPVAGATVEMGTGITFHIPGGSQLNKPVFQTTTDAQGYYVFAEVDPGSYVRRVNAFESSFYPDGEAIYYKFAVEPWQIVAKKTYHIVKEDLNLSTPVDEAVIFHEAANLKWEEYPEAQFYEVQLTPEGKSTVKTGLITGTIYDNPQSFLNGKYKWTVNAFNKYNRKIAKSLDRTFTVTGAEYSIYVQVLSPQDKASVLGDALVLEWEPYPGASYYKVWVSLKGGETIVDRIKVTGSNYTIPERLSSGTYYWTITAFNGSDGEIAKSIFLQFTVG